MIVYNITMKVDPTIQQDWMEWMKTVHLPEVLATGCFSSSRFLKVLDLDETDGSTYAIQFMAANRAIYEDYIAKFAPELRKKTWQKWGERLVSFRTLMESVD